jgi:hypothetical protein
VPSPPAAAAVQEAAEAPAAVVVLAVAVAAAATGVQLPALPGCRELPASEQCLSERPKPGYIKMCSYVAPGPVPAAISQASELALQSVLYMRGQLLSMTVTEQQQNRFLEWQFSRTMLQYSVNLLLHPDSQLVQFAQQQLVRLLSDAERPGVQAAPFCVVHGYGHGMTPHDSVRCTRLQSLLSADGVDNQQRLMFHPAALAAGVLRGLLKAAGIPARGRQGGRNRGGYYQNRGNGRGWQGGHDQGHNGQSNASPQPHSAAAAAAGDGYAQPYGAAAAAAVGGRGLGPKQRGRGPQGDRYAPYEGSSRGGSAQQRPPGARADAAAAGDEGYGMQHGRDQARRRPAAAAGRE